MADIMIQNSISQNQMESKASAAKKRIPTRADYEKFQLGATSYEAKGYLVDTPLWKAPIVAVEDTYQDIKSVGRGLKGKSNDHELGQMNGLAMKAGGLAVAGYLATKRLLPVKKGMEFVGFASFFTSMVLFPKLFIAAPVKAMYGFNIDQKYVDSAGRKKYAHTDPLFTPFDAYAPEEIEAIGDKMGVKKDMENRQDFIKRKMTKISTQANTMWMLSAGIATPIMGALMSFAIEKGLVKANQSIQTKRVNSKFAALKENPANVVKNYEDKKGLVECGKFLDKNKDKNVGEKFIDQLAGLINKSDNEKLDEVLKKDLKQILSKTEVTDVSEFIGEITLKPLSKADAAPIVFSKETIKACLTNGKNLNSNQILTPETNVEIKNRLTGLFTNAVKNEADENLVTELNKSFTETINSKLNNAPNKLTSDKIDKIKESFKIFDEFKIKNNILTEYKNHRIGEKEDSVIAIESKKASEGIIKAMGFTHKELGQMKKSPALARDIMDAKMTAIASDSNKYKIVIGKVVKLIGDFEQAVLKDNFVEEVSSAAKNVHNDFSAKAKKLSLTNVSEYISQEGTNLKSSAMKNVIESTENGLLGARGSFYKVIHVLDMFKRIQTGEVKKSMNELNQNEDFYNKNIQLMKHAIMDSTFGDHSIKLNIDEPERYQKVFGNIYPNQLDAETKGAFSKQNNLLENFQNHTKDIQEQLGNAYYKFKEKSITGDKNSKIPNKGNLKKQTMYGEIFSEFGKKTADQMHNTKHWLKLFGGIGIGVTAITLGSTLFFGKIKESEKKAPKEVKHNG